MELSVKTPLSPDTRKIILKNTGPGEYTTDEHFDPGNYIEKKEIKKMGRFIQFAIAASEFAFQASGFKVTNDEEAERTGVYIGSGIGGFEVIEREHKILLEKGPSRISPFFIPATIVNLASGNVSIRIGAQAD